MLRLLNYAIKKGVVTQRDVPAELEEHCNGLPRLTEQPCASGCQSCVSVCATNAIDFTAGTDETGSRPGGSILDGVTAGATITLDRGSCIGCNACVLACPTGTIAPDRSTEVWSYNRAELILRQPRASSLDSPNFNKAPDPAVSPKGIFADSLAIRVVSTGCSACDLELAASNNPIFDMERFGVSIVASPRFADALLITGPVPKAMHEPLLSCYRAMSEPRLVIACGTCAISGGVHKHGYAEANGAAAILPVDVNVPGCPPHPLQIIKAVLAAKRLRRA